jgi:hypothetical protein
MDAGRRRRGSRSAPALGWSRRDLARMEPSGRMAAWRIWTVGGGVGEYGGVGGIWGEAGRAAIHLDLVGGAAARRGGLGFPPPAQHIYTLVSLVEKGASIRHICLEPNSIRDQRAHQSRFI